MSKRTRNLICCTCGRHTRGRQWWNRDKGFGLCDDCITINHVADVPLGATARSFGVRGVHWGLVESEEEKDADQPESDTDPTPICLTLSQLGELLENLPTGSRISHGAETVTYYSWPDDSERYCLTLEWSDPEGRIQLHSIDVTPESAITITTEQTVLTITNPDGRTEDFHHLVPAPFSLPTVWPE